jgi:hypothetical protein
MAAGVDARRRRALIDSMALVVQITSRIATAWSVEVR